MKNSSLKKIVRFGIVGCFNTLLDFAVYMLLSNYMDISIAKMISMTIASIVAFILHKNWTFTNKDDVGAKMIALFILCQLINIAVNTATNAACYNVTSNKIISFVIATGVAMVVNFLIQNFVVFPKKKEVKVNKKRNNYKYSIVIPCYNEAENLEDLVATLEKFPKKYDVEFILVENGSKDNSRKVFKSLKSPRIKKVFVDENQGYGYGVYAGLKEAAGDFIGWLHADLQVKPKYMEQLIECAEYSDKGEKLFLKGKRKNRSILDHIFTGGMTVYETLLFKKYLNDIGAIPVLFNRELLETFEKPPKDFSFELYSLYKAKKNDYSVKRFKVILEKREKGKSSWNKGFSSKIKQSRIIMKDSKEIKRGVYR